MKFRRLLAIALLLGSAFVPALAHEIGLSTAQGQSRTDALELSNGFAPGDARQLLPGGEQGAESWTPMEFAGRQAQLLAVAPQLWEVRSGDGRLAPRDIRVEWLAGDNVSFHFTFPLPPTASAETITLRATRLADLSPGHRQLVVVENEAGAILAQKLLSGSSPALEISAARRPMAETRPGFWGFLKLGIEHIWTGYDHLLFLFGLLIVCRTFRSVVAIVSCFTLAHSLTLALATLNLVNLSPRFVEPAIAASIVFVGVENLWRRGEAPPGRWALTFAFGLIHGFGFASVLRDLGVGAGGQSLALPLFSFNLGVEIGQVAVASIVLPIVWHLRKNEAFARRGIPLLSGLVAAAGFYWLLERTFFV